MDIFFAHHEVYRVSEPIEVVRNKIYSIANKKWFDSTDNITGSLSYDRFKFTHKWSFVVISGGGKPVYLSGELKEEGSETTISITCRPNIVFIFFFYLITALFLCELSGIDTLIEGPKAVILFFLPFFNLILFGFMQVVVNGLKNKFIRLLNLKNRTYYKDSLALQ